MSRTPPLVVPRRVSLTALLCLLPLLLQTSAVLAQDEPPASSPPAPCSADSYRQFDFWIGHWDVTQNDQPAGSNHIEAIDNGCALSENWVSANAGFTGHGLNSYDRTSGRWHQTWVDSGGTLLQLSGGLENGAMVLSGDTVSAEGRTVTNRITWTPRDDGTVRQHWEAKDGSDWTTLFDGIYTRRSNSE